MAIKKHYRKNESVCEVTFTVDPAQYDGCVSASVVGEFNGWTPEATRMKRRRDGTLSVTVDLPRGRSFEFRYLIDGTRWANDSNADGRRPTPYPDAENSVVSV